MKTLLLAALLATSTAQAQHPADVLSACLRFGQAAENIMAAKHAGKTEDQVKAQIRRDVAGREEGEQLILAETIFDFRTNSFSPADFGRQTTNKCIEMRGAK